MTTIFIDLVDSDDETNSSAPSFPTISPNLAVTSIENESSEIKGAESRESKNSDPKVGLDQKISERKPPAKEKCDEVGLVSTDTTPDRPNSSKTDTSFAWKMEGVFVPFKGREMAISTKLKVSHDVVAKAPLCKLNTWDSSMFAPSGEAKAGQCHDVRQSLHAAEHSISSTQSSIQIDPNPSDSRNGEMTKTNHDERLSSPSFGNSYLKKNLLPESAPILPTFSPYVASTSVEKKSTEVKGMESRKCKRCRDSDDGLNQGISDRPTPAKAKLECKKTDTSLDRPNTSKADTSCAWNMQGVFVPFIGREMTISTKLTVSRKLRNDHFHKAEDSTIESDGSETAGNDDFLSSPSFGNSCLVNMLPTSQSYQQIEARVKSTCPQIDVLKIERLDDPRRRKKYEGHRSFLSDSKVRDQLPRD